jgi:uncharacterized protein (TIGR00297 family)
VLEFEFRASYDKCVDPQRLRWQSKLILLLVVPFTAIGAVFQAQFYLQQPSTLQLGFWTLGLSTLLGLLALAARSGTPAASATGALITANLMFATPTFPFNPLRTGLIPVLTLLVLTSLATRFGRKRKERLGTAERRHGRLASQVAANLGVASLVALPALQIWLVDSHMFGHSSLAPMPILIPAIAALSEAAADTVSSEIGQVLGGTPLMLTTLRRVEPGTDGGITFAGTLAGVLAAGIVATAGALALSGGVTMLAIAWAAGVFGLFFDSLLGATLERKGLLNNDAVNFLSTAGAAAFALTVLVLLPNPSTG